MTSLSLFSCSKKDEEDVTIEPPVDFAVQYPIDIAIIKDYLTTHYLDMDLTNPNFADNDVVIKKIDNGQASIMSCLNATTYPKLLIRPVKMHNVTYELYYLVLREGVGISPCNVDGVLTAYRGTYLSRSAATATPASELTATFFDESKFPQTYFSLYEGYIGGLITGWSEIFPKFKTGIPKINTDGTVTNSDFGAGVMFIPSGLAYYNTGKGVIPAYAPLVFSFKLYQVKRTDLDNDGVFSFQEDLDNDNYVYDYRNTILFPTTPGDLIRYADDTDKDGMSDFIDVDDDGDNYTTRFEITKPEGTNSGLSLYFPYDPIADDPSTTVIETETKGIPSYNKTTKALDYTTAGRTRIHIDSAYPVKP